MINRLRTLFCPTCRNRRAGHVESCENLPGAAGAQDRLTSRLCNVGCTEEGGGSCSPKTKGHIITHAPLTPCASSAKVLREKSAEPPSRPPSTLSRGPSQALQAHGRARGCHRAPLGVTAPDSTESAQGNPCSATRAGSAERTPPELPRTGATGAAQPRPGPESLRPAPRPQPLPPGACAARAPLPAPVPSPQERRHVSGWARRAGRRGGAHRRGSGHAAATGPGRAGRDHLGGGSPRARPRGAARAALPPFGAAAASIPPRPRGSARRRSG